MSLRKKLLTFLWAKPSGAKWLTEVEWLQSPYSQADNIVPYIDTGVLPSWDVPFEMSATITKTSANRIIVLGNYSGNLTNFIEVTDGGRLRIYITASTSTDPSYIARSFYTDASTPIPLNVPTKIWVKYIPLNDADHTIKYEMGFESLLDSSVNATDTGSFYRYGSPSSSRTFRMFFDYRSAISTFDGGFKIHQCEIKMGNQYRKYIACKDFNDVPCMYEKGTGTLAYNDGTGNFIAGRTITEVDWINLTGSQRFNTGFKPNTLSTTVKATFQLTGDDSLSRFPFGCRKAASQADSCAIYIAPSVSTNPNGYLRLDWPFQASNPRYSLLSKTEKITLEITGNYSNINGEKNTSSNVTSYDQTAPFYIGNCYTSSASGFQSAFVGKFYVVNLLNTDSREDYRYCVPAHDENNVGFFFDRINHFIMDNEGTNTDNLTWGDDIHYISYLESTGPQWIDTGIPMQANYGVEINAKQTATTQGITRYLFGDAPASTGRYLIFITSGANIYRLGLDTLNKDSDVSGYDGKYHVHKVENKTYFIDGVSQGTLNAPDFTRNRNARLFNVATTSTIIDNYWQIKQGKIIDENGNVLTNFIPVIKGNNDKPAMFDLVSRTFAINQATGDDFICGNSILGIPEETGLPMGFVPLQYLTGEGGPYIDTGIKLGPDYGVEIVVRNTNETIGKTRYLFGTATSSNRYMLAVASGTDCYLLDLESSSYRLDTSFSAYDGQFHTHKIDNKTYYIDGVSQGTSTSTGTFTTLQNAFLFGAAGVARTNSYWDIKSCKIFDGNGVLLQHLIPALRTVDGVAGMLDLVSGQFLTNAGTGEFVYAQ